MNVCVFVRARVQGDRVRDKRCQGEMLQKLDTQIQRHNTHVHTHTYTHTHANTRKLLL